MKTVEELLDELKSLITEIYSVYDERTHLADLDIETVKDWRNTMYDLVYIPLRNKVEGVKK